MSQTKELAAYGAALRYEDIPAEVLNRAKNLTLQTIGVSLAALSSDVGKRAVALGKVMGGGSTEATIWGEGSKVSAAAAGLANGTLADALDWEDCSWTGHPSACAVSGGSASAVGCSAVTAPSAGSAPPPSGGCFGFLANLPK